MKGASKMGKPLKTQEIKWLHLSDLHFIPNNYSQQLPVSSLINYLKSRGKNEKNQFDYVFITGDFRFAKTQTYETAQADAGAIAQKIKQIADLACGGNVNNIYLTPGNHDLWREFRGRDHSLPHLLKEYGDSLNKYERNELNLSEQMRDLLLQSFQDFYKLIIFNLYSQKEAERRWAKFENIHYIENIRGMHLLVLNTALMSSDDNKNGNLIVGHNYVLSALQTLDHAATCPIIVLSHYAPGFWRTSEKNIILSYFRDCGIKLILSGHAHQLGHSEPTLPDSKYKAQCITTGCLQDKEPNTCSFSTGTYNPKTKKCTIQGYNWTPSMDSPFAPWDKSICMQLPPAKKIDPRPPVSDDSESEANRRFYEYLDYLRYRCNRSSAVYYLMSGPRGKKEMSTKLPEDVFFSDFYVHEELEREEKVMQLAADLFNHDHYNMLCLFGGAGSGKTTFLRHMTRKYFDSSTKFRGNYIVSYIFDCMDLHGTTPTEIPLPFADLKQQFRKKFNQMIEQFNTQNTSWRNYFQQSLQEVTEFIANIVKNNTNTATFWGAISITAENLLCSMRNSCNSIIDMNKVHSIFRSLSSVDFFSLLGIFLLLFMTEFKSKLPNDIKYLIVFDNIETYAKNGNVIGDDYYKIISSLRSLFNGLRDHNKLAPFINHDSFSFMHDFTFVLSVRTTTNLTSEHMTRTVFGTDNEFIYTREFFNFTVEALLKKLKFLKKHDITNEFATQVERICQLLIPRNVIGNYLTQDNYVVTDEALKNFIKNKYLPFLNNDFRSAMRRLERLYKKRTYPLITNTPREKTWMDCALELNVSDKDPLYNLKINASRMILVRSVLNDFVAEGFFQMLGIDHECEPNHNLTRFILATLYYDEIFYQGSNGDYPGMSLSKVLEVCNNQCEKNAIREILLVLCQNLNPQKADLVREWGYFVTFIRSDRSPNIVESLNGEDWENITLKLSPAGWCFVDYISLQFEFFASRIPNSRKEPLILYKDTKGTEGKYAFESIIQSVYSDVENFAKAVFQGLPDYSNENFRENSAQYGKFIWSQEIFAVLTNHIDYLDRFRMLMWEKCNGNKNVNDCILDCIGSYGSLFAKYSKYDPQKNSGRRLNVYYNFSKENRSVERSPCKDYYGQALTNEEFKRVISDAKKDIKGGSLFKYIESYCK